MEPRERRWLIPDHAGPRQDPSAYWVKEHDERGYETTFSVGEDARLTNSIVDEVLRACPCRDVLVPGCGSRTALQETLLSRAAADLRVTATDFEAVVAMAARRFSHPRLTYASLEATPPFRQAFDVVVAVNVLVMDSDLANRELIESWAQALRRGGTLVLLAPLLFCGLDLVLLSEREDLRRCLDLEGSSWLEEEQGIRQIEYSPLRMRRVLKEAGLRLTDLRVAFLDGPSSREQSRLHYALDDDDLLVYEQIVVARAAD